MSRPFRPVSGPVRIGIDTAGTFTDVVAIDEATGEILTTKTPSTPRDPSVGVVDGIRKILRLAGHAASLPATAVPRPAVAAVSHGTTVATNALPQERFTGLGLVTTQGFRHVLEIARQAVPRGYGNSYFWVKPERIVPLHLVREVPERMNFRGETTGGGGWGDPLEREPELVALDALQGKVSVRAAREAYGVVLVGPDSEPQVDGAATRALRDRLRAARGRQPFFDRGPGYRALAGVDHADVDFVNTPSPCAEARRAARNRA